MISYTRQALDHEARIIAQEIRKETGRPAKMKDWKLVMSGEHLSLDVTVLAYDGLRQRNVAI